MFFVCSFRDTEMQMLLVKITHLLQNYNCIVYLCMCVIYQYCQLLRLYSVNQMVFTILYFDGTEGGCLSLPVN